MRSTLLLAALAAGCVNAFERRIYVTDWTTVTVTKTVTAPAVTETVQPAQQAQIQNTVTTTTQPAVPAAAETVSSELAKKSTVIVPISSTTQAAAAADTAAAATSYFSTAEAASSTLASATSSASTAASTAGATNSYQSAVLYNHNIHRSNHSVSSVEWSADLEASAQVLASRCVYQHDT